MSPCTDQRANAPATSHTAFENETTATPPSKDQQKRSSSWSHYHFRQLSNPFFLSRRAGEQGCLLRDKRRQRKSVPFDDTLNSSEARGNLGLAASPGTLHIAGNSKQAAGREFRGRTSRDLSQQTNAAEAQIDHPEEDNTERIDTVAKEAVNPSPIGKITFCIDSHSLPPLTVTRPAPPKDPAQTSAHLVGGPLVEQIYSGQKGTVRRKVMRTVSHDDYLLARGANPRTGVVTPSIHSGSSSIDDQDLFRTREVPETAKWRLKGDQWISLSLDEPSPLHTPPFETNDLRPGRPLRTPPKLAHGRPPHYKLHPHNFEQNSSDSGMVASDDTAQFFRKQQRNERQFSSSAGDRKDVQVQAFPALLLHKDHDRSEKDTVIRRKPLGTPPRKHSADHLSRTTALPQASTETVITKKGPEEQSRSSSMPTPRMIRSFRPEDVGKELPALPGSKLPEQGDLREESGRRGMSFLGLRLGDRMEEVSNQAEWAGQGLEKSLPCQPMNDIRFQSHRWEGAKIKILPARADLIHTNRLHNQQRRANFRPHTEGKRPAPLYSRPMIPQRYNQLAQLLHPEQRKVQRALLNVPNPSRCLPIQPQGQDRAADRNKPMITGSTGAEAGSNAHVSQSTTTPTITPTITAETSPEDRLMSPSWREIPSPLCSGRRRADTTPRPAMPERAEGTHSVPQVSPQEAAAERCQWRMTGTSDSEVSANSTSVEGSLARELIPRPLKPSKGNTAVCARGREAAVESVTDAGQPAKTCLHCQNPSSDANLHTIHGFTHTQENLLAENIDPQVDLGSTSGSVPDIPENHSGCCPECCIIGCHGSCLGHRTAFVGGSASGSAGSFGAMKQVFRNSFRLSRRIRVRTSVGGSCETEAEEVAELEAPMSWEVSGPVSLGMPRKTGPPNFWDGSDTEEGSQGKRVASNASASSVKTLEMPAAAGIGEVIEALMVPFGALRMWLKTHPQLQDLMRMIIVKLVDMSKHVLNTAGKAYQMAYVYSKTGRISPGRHTSLGRFVADCGQAIGYCLILGAVAMMVGRALAVIAGAGSWLIWSLSWVAWIMKAAGLGILW